MYLLDTNIASLFDQRRRAEAEPFIDWIRRYDPLLFLSTITLVEMEGGILKLAREGKRARAEQLAGLRDGLIADYRERLLPVGVEVALTTARLADYARPTTIDLADLIIAATARVHNLTVLTRNIRHFKPTGVPVMDPTKAPPSPP